MGICLKVVVPSLLLLRTVKQNAQPVHVTIYYCCANSLILIFESLAWQFEMSLISLFISLYAISDILYTLEALSEQMLTSHYACAQNQASWNSPEDPADLA